MENLQYNSFFLQYITQIIIIHTVHYTDNNNQIQLHLALNYTHIEKNTSENTITECKQCSSQKRTMDVHSLFAGFLLQPYNSLFSRSCKRRTGGKRPYPARPYRRRPARPVRPFHHVVRKKCTQLQRWSIPKCNVYCVGAASVFRRCNRYIFGYSDAITVTFWDTPTL